jgi:spore germination protein
MRRRPASTAAFAALVASALAGCSLLPGSGDPAVPLELTGFVQAGVIAAGQTAETTPDPLTDSAAVLDVAGIDGVVLTGGGTGVATPDDAAVAELAVAHDAGLLGELLVSNYDETALDFSPEAATTLLGDPANQQAVATALAATVTDQGWDGVMIDLESLTADNTDGLTAFAGTLRSALGDAPRLDIAVQAATDEAGFRGAGYDLAALAGIVDHITVMAYDQHGTFDPTTPGPVGGLDWQRQVVEAVVALVPPEQVDLGVAQYGYAFLTDATSGTATATVLTPAAARALTAKNAVVPTFDATAGEWTATLPDTTVLWWADLQSLALRLDLAREFGLGGAAIWSLNTADPLAPLDAVPTPAPTETPAS